MNDDMAHASLWISGRKEIVLQPATFFRWSLRDYMLIYRLRATALS